MSTTPPQAKAGGTRRSLLVLLPVIVFAGLAALFYLRLGAGDQSRIPSPLIGKQVPQFSLPSLEGIGPQETFSDADLRQGHPTLVNIFASWCVPCRDEHPALIELSRDVQLQAKGTRIIGLAYKDDPANSRRFLGEMGNPYTQIAVDRAGRTAIDWGVYGVPETFLVRGDGTILYKVIGPMTAEEIEHLRAALAAL